MRSMSETPEPFVPPVPTPPPVGAEPPAQSERLYRVAAWVAIIAGILLIVLTVLASVCMFVWSA